MGMRSEGKIKGNYILDCTKKLTNGVKVSIGDNLREIVYIFGNIKLAFVRGLKCFLKQM